MERAQKIAVIASAVIVATLPTIAAIRAIKDYDKNKRKNETIDSMITVIH